MILHHARRPAPWRMAAPMHQWIRLDSRGRTMARLAHGDQPDADLDLPIDEVASPPVAPASPSTTPLEEPPPASQAMSRPVGSNFSDLGSTFNGMARAPVDTPQQDALGNGTQPAGSIASH